MKVVENLEHLKQILSEGDTKEFVITLNGGLSSRKLLSWDGTSVFYVYNLADDTEQELTEAQLMDRSYTNVGYAMENGALLLDE